MGWARWSRNLLPEACALMMTTSTCCWLCDTPPPPSPPSHTVLFSQCCPPSGLPIVHMSLLPVCSSSVLFGFPPECWFTPQFQLLLFLIMTRITVIITMAWPGAGWQLTALRGSVRAQTEFAASTHFSSLCVCVLFVTTKCLIVFILGTWLRVTQHQPVKFGGSTLVSLILTWFSVKCCWNLQTI